MARTQHTAIALPDNRIWLFGGHHNPQCRLNDTWFLNCKDYEWRRVGKDPDNYTNAPSTIGAPDPRANSGACLFNGKIYLFGGHGGLSFARVSFADLFCFDVEAETWEKLVSVNPPPDGRGGHSLLSAMTSSISMVAGIKRCNTTTSSSSTLKPKNGATQISSMRCQDGITAVCLLKQSQPGSSSSSVENKPSTTKVPQEHSVSTLTPVHS